MNHCSLVGHLLHHATVKGSKNHVLVFTVETKQSSASADKDDVISQVPVVLFNPSPELEEQLTRSGRGTLVALQGRVNTTRYESPQGEARLTTEVIAFTKSFVVLVPAANNAS